MSEALDPTALGPPALPSAELFTRALRGIPCQVVVLGRSLPLPVDDWLREPDADDQAMTALCVGPTLDVGCGPGRLAEALADAGHAVLGIDIVPEAVRLTRRRGVPALIRDVHDRIPGEGRWSTALLADGNVGIGGDPVLLLSRLRELLAPDGRVVVELARPGVPMMAQRLRLTCAGADSETFPWSVVGVDDIDDVAVRAGYGVAAVHRHHERWCAVLEVDR